MVFSQTMCDEFIFMFKIIKTLNTIKDPNNMLPNLGSYLLNIPGSSVNGVLQTFGMQKPLPIVIPYYMVKPKPQHETNILIQQ